MPSPSQGRGSYRCPILVATGLAVLLLALGTHVAALPAESLAALQAIPATQQSPFGGRPASAGPRSPQVAPAAGPAAVPRRVYLPLTARSYAPPLYLRTRIDDIYALVDSCPNTDPAYAAIRSQFRVLIDGVAVGDIPCSGTFATMPIAQLTAQLIAIQAARVAYYMHPGYSNYLPWTSLSLYDWMTANVAGVNLKTAPGQLYCCDTIGGRKYLAQSIQDDWQRGFKRYWSGLSSTLDYYVHEIRHASGGPGHTTGCAAFPNPSDPAGCDASYDPGNLGSYGVQYWLHRAWATGYLDIGLACAPDGGLSAVTSHLSTINYTFRSRFVTNIPALLEMPSPPYGGPCYGE